VRMMCVRGIGHSEEISTLAISNDGRVLVSAQCSLTDDPAEFQTRMIVWDVASRRQKRTLLQDVQAIQSMDFSK
jgi:WD40 repeat protein